MPYDIAKGFAFADFLAIRNNTNIFFDKSLLTLLQAHKLYISGACVCLFVGGNVLQGIPGGSWYANDWVVLESPILIGGKPVGKLLAQGANVNDDKSLFSQKIEFSMYTWAQGNHPENKNDTNLTVEKFLDYFYVYVAPR